MVNDIKSHFLIPVEKDLAHFDVQTITKSSQRGTERSEIDLSEAKAPQGMRVKLTGFVIGRNDFYH